MRLEWSSLPWELLGPRPALITVTYPADWRPWCAGARQMVAHREALKERWRKAYGPPVGVHVVEFQLRERCPVEQRQAPHLHMYLGLPDCVTDEEYGGLVRRTLKRKRLEATHGKYGGRGALLAPEGEFADWLLRSWWEIVGSGDKKHRYRGADITPMYYSDQASEMANRAQVADYMWRESGKFGQKTPPENFGSFKFYGRWGQEQGFNPMESKQEVEAAVWMKERRVLIRLVDQRLAAEAKAWNRPYRPYRGPRGRDGLTVFLNHAPVVAGRIREWAEREVASRRVLPTSVAMEGAA